MNVTSDIYDAENMQLAFELISKMDLDKFPEGIEKKVGTLSGGWQKKVALAQQLMNRPNLLLLDEPTNHLDLESITSFNNALKDFPGTVLFTSHDHEFTHTVANRIIEITPNGFIDKLMTYDEYIENDKVAQQKEALYA
jgi:ATPase subunit of ABC transporter with duplicated ATPase domains